MMSDDVLQEDVLIHSIPAPGQDYYTVLGVNPSATEKQITNAFKKLSMKYHPDRNPDDDEAKIIYQLVLAAHQTLVDIEKRKIYDTKLLGTTPLPEKLLENADATTAGIQTERGPSFGMENIGKVFGKAMQRLNVQKSVTLNPDIVEVAQIIAKNDLELSGPPLDGRVVDLPFGWANEAKVDRTVPAYYRITIDENYAVNGFFIQCRSANKSKFRLFMMNTEGKIIFQEESHRGIYDSNATEVVMFFTNFATYEFADPLLAATHSAAASATLPTAAGEFETITDFSNAPVVEKESLPIFQRMKCFIPSKKTLSPGKYLLGIYGENLIGKSNLQVLIAGANNQLLEVSEILDTDKSMLESKLAVETLKTEYLQAKAAFETVTKKISAESERIDSLNNSRDTLYRKFLDKSASVYHPAGLESSSSSSSSSVPLVAATTNMFSATFSALSSVAASAMSSMSTSSHSTDANTSSTTDHVAPLSEQPTATPAQSSPTSSAAATSAPVNSFIATSKAAASTATAAGGWLAKHITAVRHSITKTQDPPVESSSPPPSTSDDQHHHHDASRESHIPSAATSAGAAIVQEVVMHHEEVVSPASEFTLDDSMSEGRPSEGNLDEEGEAHAEAAVDHDGEESHAATSPVKDAKPGKGGKKGGKGKN